MRTSCRSVAATSPLPTTAATVARLLLAATAVAALWAHRPAAAQGVGGAPHANWTEVTAFARLDTTPSTKWGGALIADLDGDGWYDLVLNNHDQTNLQLFWNTRDGRYSRAPDPLNFLIDAHGMTAGDIFLSGASDFIVMQGGANGQAPATPRLLRSAGAGRRLEQAQRATRLEADTGGRGRTPLLVDLDGDGDLDLILLNFVVPPGAAGPRQKVYENIGGAYVLRNGTGLEEANVERGILTDLNGDGRLDLVTFPFLRLYQAIDNFRFSDVTDTWMARVPDRARVGVNVWAAAELDADGDGRWDLYLARNFETDVLLRNVDNQYFEAVGGPGGPAGGSRRYGDVTVGDFNNDGATDVFLSYTVASPDGVTPVPRRDVLLTNGGGGTFTLTADHGATQLTAAAGDSVQAFDYNRDGRLDLLVGAGDEVVGRGPLGAWSLFASAIPTPAEGGGHWFLVSVGRSPGRRAAPTGARLQLTVASGGGERVLVRRVGGAGGSSTADDLRVVHFGLGPATIIRSLRVVWSDGTVVERFELPVDTVYLVTPV